MAELAIDQISVSLGTKEVLKDISLRLGQGELIALVGPNGAGKTTLLRAALGLCKPHLGSARLDNVALSTLSAAQIARKIAYLPQTRPLDWPLGVEAVVGLGRFAYGGSLSKQTHADKAAIDRAIKACRLDAFRGRSTSTLSGGELARVHIARALASESPLLIADEPNAALDPLLGFEMMDIIRSYCNNAGAALVSMHDLSLAARFADRIIVLHEGRVIADDAPNLALSANVLAEVFGLDARLKNNTLHIRGPIRNAAA